MFYSLLIEPLGFVIFQFVKSILDSNPVPYNVSRLADIKVRLALVKILSALLSQSNESVHSCCPLSAATITSPNALILFSVSLTNA